jgi:hypothetical protein
VLGPCDPPAHAGEDMSEEQRPAGQEKWLAHPRRRGIAHRGLPVSPPSIARSSPPTSSTLCTVLMLLKYQNCHTGRTVEVPRTAHTTAIVDIFFIRRLQCADESGASSGYKHVDGGLNVSIGAALLSSVLHAVTPVSSVVAVRDSHLTTRFKAQ